MPRLPSAASGVHVPLAVNGHDIELDTVADDWQVAFDAAARALEASKKTFPPDELHARRRRLAEERAATARELADLAAGIGAHTHPWLAPFAVHPSLLGVPEPTRACIFDLEGVLTDSGALHAAAWAEVLDPLLLELSQATGWHFIPFDRAADYAAYIEGRPRGEGIELFLRSRGIQLPHELLRGLAHRKSEAVGRRLRERGANALPGARPYLEAAGRAHVRRAVVSSSTRTLPILELAGLASLVEARVDAEQIASGALRSRPAPDLILRACELLGVSPAAAVSFAHTPDGVAAGLAAGVRVVAVAAEAPERERLLGFGAESGVSRLADLLDRRVLAAAA